MYIWHKGVKKQVGGLAIGLDLSRAIGRLVMLEWDKRFLDLARNNQLTMYMFRSHVLPRRGFAKAGLCCAGR